MICAERRPPLEGILPGKKRMAYQVRIKRQNGDFVDSGVVREPIPISGSTIQLMLDGRWVRVQLVGLSQRVSEGGEQINHLEGNEL